MRIISSRVIILVLTSVLISLNAIAWSDDPKTELFEAEKVAKSYMTAFFCGDIQIAANHMHPEPLNELRGSFLKELDNAKAAGRETAFLRQANVKEDGDTLRKCTAKELYVILVGSNHRRDPVFFEKMREATVEVLGSKSVKDKEAIVRLRITTPTGKGSKAQEAGLLLAKSGGEWKVKGNTQ